MADWFQFKDTRSTEMGVYVTTYPPIALPEERVEFVTVPGRSGSLTVTEGDCVYDDITLSVECMVHDLGTLDQISGWLRGRGDLVLGNRPDTYYKARVVNQIELEKIVRGRPHRAFAVVFRCVPFRYQYPASEAVEFTESGSMMNPGNVYAEPLITITGSGEIDLTIRESTLHLEDVSGSITIDTAARLAYNGSINQSFKLTGDWPVIPVGTSMVAWTGGATKVSISPNWRNI
ncbi:hypothetical protein LJC33_01020 [Eubacteriales bacterium OttesenSCG-928-N13]|nr:hypothetical protein [Eubacteriales bacterium OttesenSCG-928-N13]